MKGSNVNDERCTAASKRKEIPDGDLLRFESKRQCQQLLSAATANSGITTVVNDSTARLAAANSNTAAAAVLSSLQGTVADILSSCTSHGPYLWCVSLTSFFTFLIICCVFFR